MAVPVIQSSNQNYSDYSTVNECPAPSGITVGDLLVGVYTIGLNAALTGPTGWTELVNDSSVNVSHHGVWWKIADSSDAAASTFDFSSASVARTCALVLRIDGHDPTTPIGTQFAGNSYPSQTAAPVSPTVTTTVDDSLVILTEGGDQARADTHPSGTTVVYNANESNGTDSHQGVAWTTQATAGATGTNTWTLSAADDCYAYTVVVRPPAGTGSTGTGALSSAASQVSGSGTIGRSGSGGLSSQASEISGTGVIGRSGTGALSAAASSISGTGSVSPAGGVIGSGALASAVSAISGAGVIGRSGSGALAAVASSISGTGVIGRSGSGSLVAGAASISGVGIIPGDITGSGALISGVSSISGTGGISGWSVVPPASSEWTDVPAAGGSWEAV